MDFCHLLFYVFAILVNGLDCIPVEPAFANGSSISGNDCDGLPLNSGIRPDPLNCQKYCNCGSSTCTCGTCVNNELFDSTFLGCNYWDKVDCGDRPNPYNPTDKCDSKPCQNHGLCTQNEKCEDFICKCTYGYMGERCEKPTKESEISVFTVPVGAGDGTIIVCPSGEITIIDMGWKKGASKLLWKEDIYIFLKLVAGLNWYDKPMKIFLTHDDFDHVSYINDLLGYIEGEIEFYIGSSVEEYEKQGLVNFGRHDVYEAYGGGSGDSERACGYFDHYDTKSDFFPCRWKLKRQNGHEVDADPIDNNVNICPTDSTWSLTLMAANYFERKTLSSFSSEPNMNSLVMKLTPREQDEPSMIFLGDFENEKPEGDNLNYDQLILASSYQYQCNKDKTELNSGLMSKVLMIPHHGAKTNGNGEAKFFNEVFPKGKHNDPFLSIISSHIKPSTDKNTPSANHPNCEVIENLRAVLTDLEPNVPDYTYIECRDDRPYPNNWDRQLMPKHNDDKFSDILMGELQTTTLDLDHIFYKDVKLHYIYTKMTSKSYDKAPTVRMSELPYSTKSSQTCNADIECDGKMTCLPMTYIVDKQEVRFCRDISNIIKIGSIGVKTADCADCGMSTKDSSIKLKITSLDPDDDDDDNFCETIELKYDFPYDFKRGAYDIFESTDGVLGNCEKASMEAVIEKLHGGFTMELFHKGPDSITVEYVDAITHIDPTTRDSDARYRCEFNEELDGSIEWKSIKGTNCAFKFNALL